MTALRPIRASDRDAFQAFVRGLSAESRRQRFLSPVRELSPAALTALTEPDPARHAAFVALEGDTIVGEGRVVAMAEAGRGEFALAVVDARRRRGIGANLLGAVVAAGRRLGLSAIEGEILRTNAPMLAFLRRAGVRLRSCPGDARLVVAELELGWVRLAA
jgi:acetyltransferase